MNMFVTGFRRHASRHALALVTILLVMPLGGPAGRAQDAVEAPATEDAVPPPEISRESWHERVLEAKRRAQEAAVERRNNPERYILVPEDPDRIAIDRALNDDSLQRGDIVATKKGLFMFRGRSDVVHRDDDFVLLGPR